MQVSIIGVDIAKEVFQVAALNRAGKVVSNRSVRRSKLLHTLRSFPSCIVGLEACGAAHYWARAFRRLGHDVRIIPPQHVKAFIRVNKTDAGDAVAICEAVGRPDIHFVSIKSIPQQDRRLLCRQRESLVRSRTAIANQIRGYAREYGVFFPVGYKRLLRELPDVLEDARTELSEIARDLLAELRGELLRLSDRIEAIEREQRNLAKDHAASQALREIPGIGPVVSETFLATVGDGKQFNNGRQCAAWVGLVPRLHGSGGKTATMSITKNGDRQLRTMLVHAARAVARCAHRRDDAMSRWVTQLKLRRGTNKAVVALANKLARIAWVIVARGERFDMSKAFG